MSLYSMMPGGDAADFIAQLRLLIDKYGIDSVMGALSDTVSVCAGMAADFLVDGPDDPSKRKEALRDFDLFSFAHRKLCDASKAIDEYGAIYSQK